MAGWAVRSRCCGSEDLEGGGHGDQGSEWNYVLPDDPRFDPIYLPTPEQHQLGGYKTWLGTNVMQEDTSVIPTKNLMELLAELKEAE